MEEKKKGFQLTIRNLETGKVLFDTEVLAIVGGCGTRDEGYVIVNMRGTSVATFRALDAASEACEKCIEFLDEHKERTRQG